MVLLVPTMQAAYGGPRCAETIKPPPPRCANVDCSDPMFTVFHPPPETYVSGHCAELAVPFAIYDGRVALLLGTAELTALDAITAGSGYHPVVTDDGRGLAALMISDFPDTNAGPYREVLAAFAVNQDRVTVSTRNPYAHLAEMLNPAHHVWMHKLILTEQMPIDWGREVVGYDKDPDPQHIAIGNTSEATTFAATDPRGVPILSGRAVVDNDPQAQTQALGQAAAAGGDWLQPVLRQGGLIQANIVNPDILGRSDALVRSYAVARPTSIPSLGLFDHRSTLTADPRSPFGAALTRMAFRPVVTARMTLRLVLDRGWAT